MIFWKGSRIWNEVHEGGIRSTIITKNGGIQGFGWRNVEFAVEKVAVAQPPFAARAETFSAILHPLAKSGAPPVVLAILALRDLVPLLDGLVLDEILLGFFSHEFFLL